MNRRGQFSIIAALFVAAILISSVMVTYSSIRYSSTQDQPQIITAIDETNQALKQVLSFTVGYYGSVLQVTGNSSYAYAQSENYLNSGLNNIVDIQPQWGISFNVTALSLGTDWFTNESYSQGNLNVTYDLTGLGVTGIAYSVSCRLDVQIIPSYLTNQVYVTVVQDGNQPLVNLGLSNFKFYLYRYTNLTWGMVNPPDEPISSSNGTYTVDIPAGINPQSYIIQVQDSRGIMVAASSFSHYTGSLAFNTTTVSGGTYVNQSNSMVDGASDLGSHSNFTAQQQASDGIYDTITEASQTATQQSYHPTNYILDGSTTLLSGTPGNLSSDDGNCMIFQSYGTPSLYAHKETTIISGTTYDTSSVNSADASGLTLTAGMTGTRNLLGKFVYSLQGVTSIPASTWTMYYRAQRTDNGQHLAAGKIDVDIIVREANGSPRSTIATKAALSPSITTTMQTLTGTYAFAAYTVASQTDYLEIDYYIEVSTSGSSSTANLVVDNSGLALTDQTRASNVMLPSLYTCQAELYGPTNLNNWNFTQWAIDASSTLTNVNAVLQLLNDKTGLYPSVGQDGYLSETLGGSITSYSQNITSNPANYNDSLGNMKIRFTVTATTSTPFKINVDSSTFTPGSANYAVHLEEQWINLNTTTLLHPDLCIDTGALGKGNLAVDAWFNGGWQQITSGLTSGWNNISVNSYLASGSTNFTIRFRSTSDNLQNSWQVDAALLRPESDQSLFLSLQNPAATVAVELLQNGTMIWLGQNLQVSTQTIPIPPVPVKALHINETIDGVNQQVPFQTEDWASSYTVPLGLTNNATVFGNRQMIVFLVNTHVTDFTLWWNGSDQAIQTPLAYVDTCFKNDNPNANQNTLSNGQLTLKIAGDGNTPFTVTSTLVDTGTSSTSTFMRINNHIGTCGSGGSGVAADYVIYNGVVRDIVQQEAEWGGGVNGCPNVYDDIVLTLPANATYFTYQLSLMFINSVQTRTISDLCPINFTSTVGQLQTENGTLQGDPVVVNGPQTFNSTGTWMHHWSQFTDGTNGAGIMFTDQANQMLYAFDNMTSNNLTGALSANSSPQTISLLPVTLNPVSFQNALDVTWCGAVVTFDSSVPPIYSGNGQPGLWVLSEMPPTITETVGN